MTTLVVGATGATGQQLLAQLLDRGQQVRAIVRSPDSLPDALKNHENLSLIRATLLELSDAEMARHVEGCGAVASCLGHTLNLKGIYGQPRWLVTDATRRLCEAIKSHDPASPVRFVLMNTNGNSNRDLQETISFGEKCVIGLVRALIPPHRDNEQAADYLRVQTGQHDQAIEWVAVRPDTLTNEDKVTAYEVHASPIRSAIFASGPTSRINVGHFMAELITDKDIWNKWQGQMPVIYNTASS